MYLFKKLSCEKTVVRAIDDKVIQKHMAIGIYVDVRVPTVATPERLTKLFQTASFILEIC